MNYTPTIDYSTDTPPPRDVAGLVSQAFRALFAFGMLLAMLLIGAEANALTLAGTTIGNQASATYTDGSATVRTATSNQVITTIAQVGSFTLVANNAKTVSISGQVYYPHTLTNAGNGTDTYTLSQTNSGTFTFTTALIYADADGDGNPDNLTPITTTGPLTPGQVFKFVVAGTVPATATSGNTNAMVVQALSTFNAATATVTDTSKITSNAVINVNQSLDVTSGPSPSASSRTITITYTNTGNTTATGVVLSEIMPSGFTYVAASGRWSVTGSGVTMTDANAEDQGGITYIYDTPSGTVTATVASVPAGTSGSVSFKVNVNSNLPPGALPATADTATYAYNDGSAAIAAANTNTVQYTVLQTGAVTLVPSVTVASAAQGATVVFNHTLTNGGNGVDSFDFTQTGSTFPSGTVIQFFRADGVTPALDSNGNIYPDSGPLAAAGTQAIVVKAILPPGATGGPYTVNITATSKFDTTKTATVVDTLTSITVSAVDLVNNVAGVITGTGAGPESSAVLTQTVAPGATTVFPLQVNNNSTAADAYGLSVSTDSTFATTTLPAGWTVTFTDGNVGINGTGTVNASATKLVYANVTVPAGTATSTTDLYFRSLSPTTGAVDKLHDAVTVGALRLLTLTPDQSGQVVAGGQKTYVHQLTNNGTTTEGAVAGTATLAFADGTTGFTSVVYWDKNNDGNLDPADPIVTDLSTLTGGTNGANTTAGLAPGKSVRLFVKVTSPAGATAGTVDVGHLTVTVTGLISGVAAPVSVNATDNTQVIASQVTLTIMQALDVACNGTITGSLSIQTITTAQPGQCIRYSITATNGGTITVNQLTIFNATPAYTVYSATVPAAATAGTVTAPSDGTTGTVKTVVGDLVAGGTVTLTYGARIQP